MIHPSDDTPQYRNAVAIRPTAFLHTARHGRPSHYVIIGTSNRVTTLTRDRTSRRWCKVRRSSDLGEVAGEAGRMTEDQLDLGFFIVAGKKHLTYRKYRSDAY